LKPMHPTKFLGCNSWTLPFPIPAGGQGPAGLQSARSRAGPAGQSSGFWPLDLQRTLGCLGKPRGSDLSAKGWSGQGLEPKGEAFLRPPGCANRGRTTWFPAPRSPSSLTCGPHPSAAPTGCRPLGTQERTQWAFPAATATPERTTGKPSPANARLLSSDDAVMGFFYTHTFYNSIFHLDIYRDFEYVVGLPSKTLGAIVRRSADATCCLVR